MSEAPRIDTNVDNFTRYRSDELARSTGNGKLARVSDEREVVLVLNKDQIAPSYKRTRPLPALK